MALALTAALLVRARAAAFVSCGAHFMDAIRGKLPSHRQWFRRIAEQAQALRAAYEARDADRFMLHVKALQFLVEHRPPAVLSAEAHAAVVGIMEAWKKLSEGPPPKELVEQMTIEIDQRGGELLHCLDAIPENNQDDAEHLQRLGSFVEILRRDPLLPWEAATWGPPPLSLSVTVDGEKIEFDAIQTRCQRAWETDAVLHGGTAATWVKTQHLLLQLNDHRWLRLFKHELAKDWQGEWVPVEAVPALLLEAKLPLPDDMPMPNAEPVVAGAKPQAEVRMTWQEAAEALERRRKNKRKFTSCQLMADEIGCSKTTVAKAIQLSPGLQSWVARAVHAREVARSAETLTDAVTDQICQTTESDPLDIASMSELQEICKQNPEAKAWLGALPRAEQVKIFDDPDQFFKIFGRKA